MADALARSCKAQHEGWASGEQGVYMGIQYLLSLWVSPSPPPLHLWAWDAGMQIALCHGCGTLGVLSSQNFPALGSLLAKSELLGPLRPILGVAEAQWD